MAPANGEVLIAEGEVVRRAESGGIARRGPLNGGAQDSLRPMQQTLMTMHGKRVWRRPPRYSPGKIMIIASLDLTPAAAGDRGSASANGRKLFPETM